MKKSLFLFLFAITMTIASFAQLQTPIVSHDGYKKCEDDNVFQSSVTDGDFYFWDYSVTGSTGGYFWDNTGDYATAETYPSDIYATTTCRVKYRKGSQWSAWSNWCTAKNYVEPGDAPQPTGQTNPVTSVSYTYSIPALDGVESYVWDVDGGSYSGSSSTNSISVTFYNQFTEYGIAVAGWNSGCSQGSGSTKKIVNTLF